MSKWSVTAVRTSFTIRRAGFASFRPASGFLWHFPLHVLWSGTFFFFFVFLTLWGCQGSFHSDRSSPVKQMMPVLSWLREAQQQNGCVGPVAVEPRARRLLPDGSSVNTCRQNYPAWDVWVFFFVVVVIAWRTTNGSRIILTVPCVVLLPRRGKLRSSEDWCQCDCDSFKLCYCFFFVHLALNYACVQHNIGHLLMEKLWKCNPNRKFVLQSIFFFFTPLILFDFHKIHFKTGRNLFFFFKLQQRKLSVLYVGTPQSQISSFRSLI